MSKKMTKKRIEKIKRCLYKKVDKAMSEWVRRNAKGVCFTCGKKQDWKKCNAGHYIHGKLDFCPINRQNQCVRCNKWLSGNLGLFAENIIRKFGVNALSDLRERSKLEYNPEIWELEDLLEYWTEMLGKLRGNGRLGSE